MATIKGTTLTPAPSNASFNIGGPAYYQGGSPIADYNKFSPDATSSGIINVKESVYPEIVVDKAGNTSNGNLKYNLTVEEYYDLLHHTHSSADTEDATLTERIQSIESQLTQLKTEVQNLSDGGLDVGDWDATTPEKETDPTGGNSGSGDNVGGSDIEDLGDDIIDGDDPVDDEL